MTHRAQRYRRRERIITWTAFVVLTAGIIILGFAMTAQALECTQSDGQPGVFINGQGSDDDRCLTDAEYAERFSVGNLVDVGVASDPVDNGDGTTTVSINGAAVTLVTDPLERAVAANTNPASPAYEPDAPTVREVLFRGRHLPA